MEAPFDGLLSAPILGDPRAVSRVRRKGGTKVFQVRAKEPLGTDSHRTISKNASRCRLLIGHKKCFVLLCPIGEHISWVLFVCSYTTAIVSITACLAHAPKKCTQSGNFQFDIKPPSDFKILSARKLKALFQKYKLQVTTGIRPWIGHVLRKYIYRELFKKIPRRKRHMEKWIHIFSVSIVIIPTHLPCQMQANPSGAEFLSTISKFKKSRDRCWANWWLSRIRYKVFGLARRAHCWRHC